MKEKLQIMIPFEGDLSIYHVIWLDRGINNFQPRSSNFMESAYASEENRNGASFGKSQLLNNATFGISKQNQNGAKFQNTTKNSVSFAN